MEDGPTATTLAGFSTPVNEKSQAGRVRQPRSVRKSPEPSRTAVVPSGGAEPTGREVGVVRIVNAAAAPMTGKPIDRLGDPGQLAGWVIPPLANASLLESSGKPFSGFRTSPCSRTTGRGDDRAGKRAHAWRARSSRATTDWPVAAAPAAAKLVEARVATTTRRVAAIAIRTPDLWLPPVPRMDPAFHRCAGVQAAVAGRYVGMTAVRA